MPHGLFSYRKCFDMDYFRVMVTDSSQAPSSITQFAGTMIYVRLGQLANAPE